MKLKNIAVLILCLLMQRSLAQDSFTAETGSYGVDHQQKIVVWNPRSLDSVGVNSIQFDRRYTFLNTIKEYSPTGVYPITSQNNEYTLYISDAPIIAITVDDSLAKFPKKPGTFRYYDSDTTFTSAIGMALRGNLSLTYPKKSFNIEFYQDSIATEQKKVSFKNLIEEDDWILDGMYNEPLLLRANFSQQLWKEIYPPHYQTKKKNARSGVDGFYVDLFINNEYRGVYFLSEKVNRSLLKLKKKKNDTVRGELFKASAYADGTSFKNAPAFKNSLPMWAGFEMKYPIENYTSHWDALYETVHFIAHSDEKTFATNIQDHMIMENVMDYFLFVNLLRATDNLGKNYYLAKYKQEDPYFFVPWDLDGVLGTILDGRQIPTTDDILSNQLFDRLLKENPNSYNKHLSERWKRLRADMFSNKSLNERLKSWYEMLDRQQFYKRDTQVWKIPHSTEDFTYLLEWLEKRLAFLDAYFKE